MKLLILIYIVFFPIILYSGEFDIDAIVKTSKKENAKQHIASKAFIKDSQKSFKQVKDEYYWEHEYVPPEAKSSDNMFGLCFTIKNKDMRNECLAIKNHNRSYCFAIANEYTKNDCLANADGKNSYCYAINNDNLRFNCLAGVAQKASLCYAINQSDDLRNSCIGISQHNNSICYSINNMNIRNYCIALTR